MAHGSWSMLLSFFNTNEVKDSRMYKSGNTQWIHYTIYSANDCGQDRGEWGLNSTLDVERYLIGSVTSAEYRECKTLNVLTPEIAVEKVTDNKD